MLGEFTCPAFKERRDLSIGGVQLGAPRGAECQGLSFAANASPCKEVQVYEAISTKKTLGMLILEVDRWRDFAADRRVNSSG